MFVDISLIWTTYAYYKRMALEYLCRKETHNSHTFFFEQMEKGDPYGNVARIIGKEKIGFFHIDSIWFRNYLQPDLGTEMLLI